MSEREYAKVIEDSINEEGVRLTTFEIRIWRPMLPEFNTHCVLSRNSASSRAIPFKKQLAKVRSHTATPLSWPVEQKGMQGGEELDGITKAILDREWREVAEFASSKAETMAGRGLHKSIVNRLLEPFMWHTVVCTATAWENFFEQRCSPLAQPEIRAVAELMRDAREDSKPRELGDGEWHLPYIDAETMLDAQTLVGEGKRPPGVLLAKISAARCARVSYLTQDGRRDVREDLDLYQKLVSARPAHWSPLEHVATPWVENRQSDYLLVPGLEDNLARMNLDHLPRVGKLLTYRTLRTTVEAQLGECTFK